MMKVQLTKKIISRWRIFNLLMADLQRKRGENLSTVSGFFKRYSLNKASMDDFFDEIERTLENDQRIPKGDIDRLFRYLSEDDDVRSSKAYEFISEYAQKYPEEIVQLSEEELGELRSNAEVLGDERLLELIDEFYQEDVVEEENKIKFANSYTGLISEFNTLERSAITLTGSLGGAVIGYTLGGPVGGLTGGSIGWILSKKESYE